jgi:pimeloyl-ACP methyl ester carboxylesterase
MSEAVAAAMASNKSKSSYWRTLRSELAQNMDLFSVPVPSDESYESIPLVLLRAPQQEGGVPPEVQQVIEAKRSQTHARILAASTRSSAIDVPGTSHDIQLDRPEAVVSAITKMLGTATAADAPLSAD